MFGLAIVRSDNLVVVDLVVLDFIERPHHLELLNEGFVLWDGGHGGGVMLLVAHDDVRHQRALAGQEGAAALECLRMPHL